MAKIYGRSESEKVLLSKYPKEVKTIEDIGLVHQIYKQKETTGLFGFLKKWSKQRELEKFEKNKNSLISAGASGELQVLQALSKLPDSFHVLCGLNIFLPYYTTYNGKKNLRSAQIDFVVVCKKGVILLEVKNWSNQFYGNGRYFSPHEQADRAARILWIILQSWRSPSSPHVHSVLVSTRAKMRDDPRFKFVTVLNLDEINDYIQNRRDEFSEKEVEALVNRLKHYVTR